jgi:hypothetical protein
MCLLAVVSKPIARRPHPQGVIPPKAVVRIKAGRPCHLSSTLPLSRVLLYFLSCVSLKPKQIPIGLERSRAKFRPVTDGSRAKHKRSLNMIHHHAVPPAWRPRRSRNFCSTAPLKASACFSCTSSRLFSRAVRHERERSLSKRASMCRRASSSLNSSRNWSAISFPNSSEEMRSSIILATHPALRARYFSPASSASLSSGGMTLPRTPFSSSLRSMYSIRLVSGRMAFSSKR